MDLSQIFSPIFIDRVLKGGGHTFIFVIFLVVFNHWGIFRLNSSFVDFLHFYLLINGTIGATLIYRRQQARKSNGKKCPQCEEMLESLIEYKCPACGKITFQK